MDDMVENLENKKIIAVIPARGGSKRIPYKNIINFHGKPLIAWTIEAALKSNLFDEVIVSTDDKKIAEIAEKYGAKVPFLREEYADDYSPVSLVTTNVLEKLLSKEFDMVVQLMPNCPLRNSNDIKEAVQNFIEQKNDFQISCFSFGWMNPWWAYQLDEEYNPKPIFEDDMRNRRSQDQPPLYCPTGAIWVAKAKKLLESKNFYGENYRFFPMSWQSALDIDNYDDLEMAQAVFLLQNQSYKI